MGEICRKCEKDVNDNCTCNDNKTVWEPDPEPEHLSLLDYMQICSYAVEIVDNITTLEKADERRKNSIKKMAIEIAEAVIKEAHASYFP